MAILWERLATGYQRSDGAPDYLCLEYGRSTLALGAYSVHFIPDKKNWTLIVNKNVTSGAVYNSAEDVARAPMELGELPTPQKDLQLAFAHTGNECSLRAYYQKTGAFAAFVKK